MSSPIIAPGPATPASTTDGPASTVTSTRLRDQLRSPVGRLLGIVFTIDAMTALVVIAFGQSYLIETRHAPPAYPAYSLAIYGLVKLLSAPLGGWAIDRVRQSHITAFIIASELAGFALVFITASANGYLLAIAFISTGIAVAWLVVFHALGDTIDPALRGAATAYVGITSAIATGAGFGAAALIGETGYWEAAFSLGIVLALVSAVLLLRLHPWGPAHALVHTGEPAPATPARYVDRQSQIGAGLVVFAHFVAVTGTIAVFGPYALRVLGLSLFTAGLTLAPAAIIGAITMIALGRRSRPGNRLREIAILYALGAAAVFGLAPVDHAWLFLLVAIPLAISIGGSQPLLNASLLDVSQSSQRTGSALGWLFFAEGLGSVIGPMLIGSVITATDIRTGLIALGAIDCFVVFLAATGSRAIRL